LNEISNHAVELQIEINELKNEVDQKAAAATKKKIEDRKKRDEEENKGF